MIVTVFTQFELFLLHTKHLHAKIEVITKGYATDE